MAAEHQGDLEFVVESHDEDRRLDRYLRERLPELARGQVFKLLRTGKIRVDGQRAEAGTRLATGARITVRRAALGSLEPPSATPSVGPGPGLPTDWIVEQDRDILAIDKPAGLALHPGQGIADHLTDRVRRHLAGMADASDWPPGFSPAPGHRLDRATSGIVLFGVSPPGVRAIAAAFRERRAQKTYLALLSQEPRAAHGTIEIPLSSAPAPRGNLPRTYPDPQGGQPAITEYACLGKNISGQTVVELRPKTGRNHQLRAHLAAIGCPIVGDFRYGGRKSERLWLHAWRLIVDFPELGIDATRSFTAKPEQSLEPD